MNIGEAWVVFKNIDSDQYDVQEKGQAIYDICRMETHNSITKATMLRVIWWLLGLVFELPERKDENDGQINAES